MLKTPQVVADRTLTAEHHERVWREAPEVLSRHGAGWRAEQVWGVGELVFTALVSLAGLLLLGWSARGVLLFTLACVWMGIACELLKLVLAFGAVRRATARHNDVESFWDLARAIRLGRTHQLRQREPYNPAIGILVDVLFGGAATIAILVSVDQKPHALLTALDGEPGAKLMLYATLGLQLLGALAAIVRHSLPGEHAPISLGAGHRGLGLFLVMVPIAVFGGGAQVAVVVINSALLLLAALLAADFLMRRAKVQWLRGYVARDAGRAAQPTR